MSECVTPLARHARAALILAALCGAGHAAQAASNCTGEFSSAALQPLPSPAVVGLDLSASSPTTAALAQAFLDGMKYAGVSLAAPQQTGTVGLQLTWSVLAQGGSSSAGGTGLEAWPQTNSEEMLTGGVIRQSPDIPNYDIFAPATPAQSGLLIMRAEAHDRSTGAIDWIGTLQCTMVGSSNQALAYQLGLLVGGAFGKRVSRAPM